VIPSAPDLLVLHALRVAGMADEVKVARRYALDPDRVEGLVTVLQRFGGYGDRFATALAQVARGQRRYVDEPGLDSAHTVWFQLHEDLLATLNLSR